MTDYFSTAVIIAGVLLSVSFTIIGIGFIHIGRAILARAQEDGRLRRENRGPGLLLED